MLCLRVLCLGFSVAVATHSVVAAGATPEASESTSLVAVESTLPYGNDIRQFVDHVGKGQIDEALALMDKHARTEIAAADRENLRKQISAIYGAAGDYDGSEIVNLRRVTKRCHTTCIVGYHAKTVIVYRFKMYKFQGRWRIANLNWDRDIEKLESVAPIEPVTGTKQASRVLSLDSTEPVRPKELIFKSDELRKILDEWERIWFLDQPSHLTPFRTQGGII